MSNSSHDYYHPIQMGYTYNLRYLSRTIGNGQCMFICQCICTRMNDTLIYIPVYIYACLALAVYENGTGPNNIHQSVLNNIYIWSITQQITATFDQLLFYYQVLFASSCSIVY